MTPPEAISQPIPPPARGASLPPWVGFAGVILAAACALAAVWAGRMCLAARSEAALLRGQQRLAELELRSARNRFEAEHILTQRQLADDRAHLEELGREIARLQAAGRK